MVNRPREDRSILWALPPCAVVLCLAAWLRGAEYDEQYTLFLTAGVPRPHWPDGTFPAGLASVIQAGHGTLASIGRDLRVTDVHPPLYFWLVAPWRALLGSGLFAARLLSVALGLVALGLTGVLARLSGLSPWRAMAILLGCYGFTYTSVIARGFALAQVLLLAAMVCLVAGRRTDRHALAGLLLGAATFTNDLALFVAVACLAFLTVEAAQTGVRRPVLAAAGGFLLFIPADLWWFLAQRGARDGQFPPFSWPSACLALAKRAAGAVLGGLPLYVPGPPGMVVAVLLGAFLAAAGACLWVRWKDAGPRRNLFGLCAIASPIGLLALGAVFDNTPIEIRYLAFSLPFLALLLAGCLGPRLTAMLLTIQTASILGLMLAPQTMQPGRAAARAAAALAKDGVVILPLGNDGVGVVGAFAIEAPPGLPLLLVPRDQSPDALRVRIAAWDRAAVVHLEVDAASRAASQTMRRAMAVQDWRPVAGEGAVTLYERQHD